ncbi:hypothetical protein JCM11491_005833 [Sporobolomyces phaffii]
MLHTPSDPYRRSHATKLRLSRPALFSPPQVPVPSAAPSLPRPPLRANSTASISSRSSYNSQHGSADSWRSSTTLAGDSGAILIKQDCLDRLKGSLSPFFDSTKRRRPSVSSFRSTDSRSSSFVVSPVARAADDAARTYLDSLDLSSRLHRFLTHFLTRVLPRTRFEPYFPRATAVDIGRSVPYEIVSTPDPSPTFARFRDPRATPPSATSYWVRAPALLPLEGLSGPHDRDGGKDAPFPALPALFGELVAAAATMTTTTSSRTIHLGCEVWEFEKLGPESDQSFWHLRLEGRDGLLIKVAFDQAFGRVGRGALRI